MSNERNQGVEPYARRDNIHRRVKSVASYLAKKDHPRASFAQSVATNIDELGIDFSRQFGTNQINSILPSIYGAFNFATYAIKGRFNTDAEIATQEQCLGALQKVLADPEANDIFHKNIGEMPITCAPDRVVPLHYVIRAHFGDQPIVIVDLGAGPGYTLPSLATAKEIKGDVANKNDLITLLETKGDPHILGGISVDKLKRKQAVFKAKAYTHDAVRDYLDTLDRDLNAQTFPFVVADISDTDGSTLTIRASINDFGTDYADVVTSSFVRYQLGENKESQNEFFRLVSNILSEGGILIDVGEEMLGANDSGKYNVNVYQKQRDQLINIGIPFEISDNGIILDINMDYFQNNTASIS